MSVYGRTRLLGLAQQVAKAEESRTVTEDRTLPKTASQNSRIRAQIRQRQHFQLPLRMCNRVESFTKIWATKFWRVLQFFIYVVFKSHIYNLKERPFTRR